MIIRGALRATSGETMEILSVFRKEILLCITMMYKPVLGLIFPGRYSVVRVVFLGKNKKPRIRRRTVDL